MPEHTTTVAENPTMMPLTREKDVIIPDNDAMTCENDVIIPNNGARTHDNDTRTPYNEAITPEILPTDTCDGILFRCKKIIKKRII